MAEAVLFMAIISFLVTFPPAEAEVFFSFLVDIPDKTAKQTPDTTNPINVDVGGPCGGSLSADNYFCQEISTKILSS
jgi:hypothetical protein